MKGISRFGTSKRIVMNVQCVNCGSYTKIFAMVMKSVEDVEGNKGPTWTYCPKCFEQLESRKVWDSEWENEK